MSSLFIYLKPTSWSPKESFYAIKHGNELHPCTYHSDAIKGKYESFIRGEGWKKSKTATLIPLFTGTTIPEFEDYIKQWGKACFFYSVTGKQINDDDCIVWAARQEFMSAMGVGMEYYQKFVTAIRAINDKIYEVMEKRGFDIHQQYITKDEVFYSTRDFFVVRPSYSIMAYFITAPTVDVIEDDAKLWKHYVEEYRPETDEELNNVFPVCMKDRITFLFGIEVSDMYEKLMKDFPITGPVETDSKDS